MLCFLLPLWYNPGKVVIDMEPKEILLVNTPPETVPLDRTNGAPRPLKWCMVTAAMVH